VEEAFLLNNGVDSEVDSDVDSDVDTDVDSEVDSEVDIDECVSIKLVVHSFYCIAVLYC
jgi:hypothetical protein